MNFAKAFRAALDPRNWRAMIHGVVPTIEHREALRDILPATVIDVGANKGQFAAFALNTWPRAKLHVFEPLSGPRELLTKIVGSRSTVHPVAAGNADGEHEIHVATRADSSSLLPIGEAQERFFGTTRSSVETIPVRRLDSVLDPTGLARPALIKIDVQGFEYEVLQGLGPLADTIDWIFIEASFIELYEGQRLFDEVDALVRSLGFALVGRHDSQFTPEGRAVQADLLYGRAG